MEEASLEKPHCWVLLLVALAIGAPPYGNDIEMGKLHANEVASDFIGADVHICLDSATFSGGLSTNLGGVVFQEKKMIP